MRRLLRLFRGSVESAPEVDLDARAAQRLSALAGRARLTLIWERLWPRLWAPMGVVGAFLVAALLGLFDTLGPDLRMAAVALFGVALLAALVPLAFLRPPKAEDALARLDRDSGVAHAPARTLRDGLAVGSDDAGTRALWEIHRRRAREAVDRMRVAAPSPGMPARDRYALRAAGVLAVVASAFVAGPEIGPRLTGAFDWRAPAPAEAAFRVDGWIDPPVYTRTPPLVLDLASGAQHLRAPVFSTLVLRIAGEADAAVSAIAGLEPVEPPVAGASRSFREERYRLTGDAQLELRRAGSRAHLLTIESIPDTPPTIEFAGPPEIRARGQFVLSYIARDDYGVAQARAMITPPAANEGRRSLLPPPDILLALPPAGSEEPVRTNVDQVDHPWAGAPVSLQLQARDEAGQKGYSEPIDFTLPQRPFSHPLARALVEQRRELVLDPDGSGRVQTALDSLLIAPEVFEIEWGVFLGLRSASTRLREARDDDDLVGVAEWLWAMALQIEDGALSAAEQALRAAQQALQEALDRDASEEELSRLMDELRQAMNDYLREFAERMMRDQQGQDQQADGRQPDRTITQNDLERMMDAIQDAMRRGDMAEAQRLLDQLRDIMQNLQTARPDSMMTDPMAREMERQFDELEDLTREQERLRDDTFSDMQNERMGRREPRDGGEGENGEQGLSDRQQALRDRLDQLQQRMRELGMQGEQGLADAEDAMRDAERALGQGPNGDAVDSQGRAIEGLQRGMQGMAQQMQDMMGDGEGGGQQGGTAQQRGQGRMGETGERDTDPLGRPMRNRGYFDSDVRVPGADESQAQRARRIMEELRRRLGDPNLPDEARDYLERLLRPN
ncbi:MAG: TIGR02302 family protein [Salinarimonadaceae bacterium]|nr:MAG: TIGR02302 family protein [Salinarimonadaceae bacterium]